MMGFFKRNYDKPGPGIPKDAPPKKGVARFFEILGCHLSDLIKLNFIFFLCTLPLQVFLTAAFAFSSADGGLTLLPLFLAALLGGIPVGPAYAAMCHIISKMLRDDPGFLWHDFKTAFKSNFKAAVVPGIVLSLFFVMQALFAYIYIRFEAGEVAILAIFLFSVVLLTVTFPFYFIQASYLDIGTMDLAKNSFLLALAHFPRGLAGGLLGTGLVILQLLFLPVTAISLLLFGCAVPCLLNLMWIWPVIDRTFKIDETLRAREYEKSEGLNSHADSYSE